MALGSIPADASKWERTHARYKNADMTEEDGVVVAKGKANWKYRADKDRGKLNIGIQNLVPNDVVDITVCGTQLLGVQANGGGQINMRMKSKKGNTVPVCTPDQTIHIVGAGVDMTATFEAK